MATGFSAGSAFVRILPSLDGFKSALTTELEKIDAKVEVKVKADTAGLREEVEAACAAITGIDVTVNIVIDLDGVAAAAAAIAALQGQLNALGAGATSVRIQLNSTTFLGELAKIQTELNTLAGGKVEIDADTRRMMEALAEARVELRRLEAMEVSPVVDADTALARHRIEQLERELARIAGRQYKAKVDVDSGSSHARVLAIGAAALYAIPALASLSSGALSLAGSLVAAAGAAYLLPAALAGIAGGVAAIKLGTSGITDAFDGLTKAQEESGTAAAGAGAKQASQASAVKAAVRGVEDAQRQADRTATDGARSVVEAQRGVADAIAATADQVAAAEQQVQRAQESRLLAQEDLTRAVLDAREAQEDLALSLRGAGLSEEAAVLGLERARQRLAKLPPDSSALDYREAELAVRRASLAVDEASEQHIDLQQASAESARVGISGAEGVVAAQRRVTEANRGVSDAETELVKARTDGAQSVARAQEQAAQAQAQAAQANEDASRQVQRAQEQLAGAYQSTGDTGSAAASKAADAMAKLAPSAQEFVRAVWALKPAWAGVKLDVQQRLFEGIGDSLTGLSDKQLPGVRDGLVRIAGGFNDGATAAIDFLSEAAQVDDVRDILDSTGHSSEILGEALTPISGMFLDISAVGAPILEEIAAGFLGSTERAADFIAQARETGELEGWIRGGLDVLSDLGQVASNTGSILYLAFTAADDAGAGLLETVVRGTAALETYLRSADGQTTLSAFFSESRDIIDALVPGIETLARAAGEAIATLSNTDGLTRFSSSLSDASETLAPLLPMLGQLAGDTFSALGGGISVAATGLQPVIDGIGNVLGLLGDVPGAVVAMYLAFKGLGVVNTAVTGLGNSLAGMITKAGGSQVAATTAYTAFSRVGSAIPIIGLAVVGLAYAYDALTTSASEAADSVLKGETSIASAIADAQAKNAEEAKRAETGGLLNIPLVDHVAKLNAELKAQYDLLSPLAQKQADVTTAQKTYDDAVKEFTADSPQARAALLNLQDATTDAGRAQEDAAVLTRDTTEALLEQQRAQFAAGDADLTYLDSIDRIAEAQERAAEAAREHGDGSKEAATAARDVLRANLDAAAAAGAKAEADAKATGSANAAEIGAKAQKDELLRLAEAADGPTRAALLNLANGVDLGTKAESTAEIQTRLHKEELLRLAGQADGPLAASLHTAVANFDTLGGANATAEQKAQAQKDELLRLAAAASGPLRTELLRMADQIKTLPDKAVTVTADGKMGLIMGFGAVGGPQLTRAAHGGATGGIIDIGPAGITGIRAAAGGILPGYTPGRDVHRFVGAAGTLDLSGNEAIMRPEWTRAKGPAYVHAANEAARRGGVPAVKAFLDRTEPRRGEGQQGDGSKFAAGGIYRRQRFARGGLFRTGIGPFKVLPQRADYEASSEMAFKLKPLMAAKVKAEEARRAAAATGGPAGPTTVSAAKALAWGRTQAGKPYIWGGVGPRGFDCSGFMSALVNVMRGRNPYSRVGATGSFPWPGFKPGTGPGLNIGAFRGSPGHMAGTIGGINLESSGSAGVRVGGGARGVSNPMFRIRAHLADRGGMIGPGEAGLNLTGRAERYLTARQNLALERLVDYAMSAGYGTRQGPVRSPDQWAGQSTAGGRGGDTFHITVRDHHSEARVAREVQRQRDFGLRLAGAPT